MNNIVEIKNISKDFYSKNKITTAIKDISLDVKDGEFVAIVGPSGCGKSTLLNILCNLDKPTSGQIILKNNAKIGYMLQQDCLFPWLTIFENCCIGLKIENKLTKENKEYVKNLLYTYGLKDFINSYPNSLSGGMRQRVALIRTLAIKPDILLLDEPFSALDYQSRLAVCDDVYRIIKKEKKTIIMITHDIAEAISMADRIVILTGRPAMVKKIMEVKLTNSSTPINNRKCVEFSKYYESIWKELDFHV
mgnify:FL=1